MEGLSAFGSIEPCFQLLRVVIACHLFSDHRMYICRLLLLDQFDTYYLKPVKAHRRISTYPYVRNGPYTTCLNCYSELVCWLVRVWHHEITVL
jgi:hypothetical protein